MRHNQHCDPSPHGHARPVIPPQSRASIGHRGSWRQHGAQAVLDLVLDVVLIAGYADFGGRVQIKPNAVALKSTGVTSSAHILLPTEYSTGNSSA